MGPDDLGERRRLRLREEMGDAGLRLRLDGTTGESLLAEIDYARFPPVHERALPTYGAILLSGPSPAPEDLGAVVHRGGAEEIVRLMADGRQAFVLRRRGRTELVVLPTPHDLEGEVVRLREQFGPSRFTAIQRTAVGVVRVFAPSALAVWDGARWWEKPYATAYARAVARAVPDASAPALEAILEFCVHRLSPSPAGAILVWALEESVLSELSALPTSRGPALSLRDRLNHGPLRQLLSQVDGAALLSPSAELAGVRLLLPASAEAYQRVAVDPVRGTRHAAGRRFSYDSERAVVFVVSEDGPVTVYFKGAAVASIRSRVEEEDQRRDALSPPERSSGGRGEV